MRYPPFLSMLLVAIGIGLAACGSSTEGDADTADDAQAQAGAPQDEAVGRYIATGTSTECSMTTNVTATKVSGHFTCPKVTGYNQADRSMGDVAIEIEFEANS